MGSPPQRTRRKTNVFVGEPFDKLKALSKAEGIPTNELHSSPVGEILAEGQRLRENRHLPILPKKNISLSKLRVSNESRSSGTSGR